MDDALLAGLLSASDMQKVNTLIVADPFISDPANWFTMDSPAVRANAVEALAATIQESLHRVIRKRCREIDANEAILAAEPLAIRYALYPEAAGWNTYAAIGHAAGAVRIGADGDRFETNLILSDEDLPCNLTKTAPDTLAFCAPGSLLVHASKNELGFWQASLFRVRQSDGSTTCCQIMTSAKAGFSFHPEATLVHKLFQYSLPVGGRSVIAKDLLDQLQQTIYDSVIPFSLQDQVSRYGYDRFLNKVSLGLEFKLRRSQKKQLAYHYTDSLNGKPLHIYLFKLRFERQHEQTTKHTLIQLYFKTGRHVTFLRQGMVIANLGADFIEFSAGLKHLRNHLLVSVADVKDEEIESLKKTLAAYLAGDEMLLRLNSIYNEELTKD